MVIIALQLILIRGGVWLLWHQPLLRAFSASLGSRMQTPYA